MRPNILKDNRLKLTADRVQDFRTALVEIVEFKKGEPIEDTIPDDMIITIPDNSQNPKYDIYLTNKLEQDTMKDSFYANTMNSVQNSDNIEQS